MKRGDIILIGVVIVAALAFMVPKWLFSDTSENKNNGEKLVAVITVDGKHFKSVELSDKEQEIKVTTANGHSNVLKVHDHGIEMIDADCPDKVCLTFGFVTRSGDTIVCLPNRVLVEIVSPTGEEGDLDAVVG